MNREINASLEALAQRLEGKGQKCDVCGCELMSEEAVEGPKGQMLCEQCASEMGESQQLEAKSGAKFKKLVKMLKARGGVEDPAALAAWIGRKKYGAKKFAQMAAAGKKK